MIEKSLNIYTEDTEHIHFLTASTGQHFIYGYDENLVNLINVLNEPHTLDDVHQKLNTLAQNKIPLEDIANVIEVLMEDNLVREYEQEVYSAQVKNNRYARQIAFFDEYSDYKSGQSVQQKIESSTVTLMGLGGIGSWIATSLGMSGVGRIILVDYDYVEETNLTRQNLYGEKDIGRKKGIVLKEKLEAINSNVSVSYIDLKVEKSEQIDKFVSESTIVISCMDYPSVDETGRIVSESASKFNVPYIIAGGYMGHLGMIGPTVLPGETACWDCIVKSIEKEYEDWVSIKGFEPIGTLGCLAAVIANIHAWEAISVISDKENAKMLNSKIEFDFVNLEMKRVSYSRDDDCETCSKKQRSVII